MATIKNSFEYQDYEYHIECVYPGDKTDLFVSICNAGGGVVCTSRGHSIGTRSAAHQFAKEIIRERLAVGKTAYAPSR